MQVWNDPRLAVYELLYILSHNMSLCVDCVGGVLFIFFFSIFNVVHNNIREWDNTVVIAAAGYSSLSCARVCLLLVGLLNCCCCLFTDFPHFRFVSIFRHTHTNTRVYAYPYVCLRAYVSFNHLVYTDVHIFIYKVTYTYTQHVKLIHQKKSTLKSTLVSKWTNTRSTFGSKQGILDEFSRIVFFPPSTVHDVVYKARLWCMFVSMLSVSYRTINWHHVT